MKLLYTILVGSAATVGVLAYLNLSTRTKAEAGDVERESAEDLPDGVRRHMEEVHGDTLGSVTRFREQFDFSYGHRKDEMASEEFMRVMRRINFNGGDYGVILPPLMDFIEKHPDTTSAASACFVLAVGAPDRVKTLAICERIESDSRLPRWLRILAADEVFSARIHDLFETDEKEYIRRSLAWEESQESNWQYLDAQLPKDGELGAITAASSDAGDYASYQADSLLAAASFHNDLGHEEMALELLSDLLRAHEHSWVYRIAAKRMRRRVLGYDNLGEQRAQEAWHTYQRTRLKYGARESQEASEALLGILGNIDWDRGLGVVLPPLLSFLDEHGDTATAATVCHLLVARCGYPTFGKVGREMMDVLNGYNTFWQEMSENQALKPWQRILAEERLFIRSQANIEDAEERVTNHIGWLEGRLGKARVLDSQLVNDTEFREYTRLIYGDRCGMETHYEWEHQIDRAEIYLRTGSLYEARRILNDLSDQCGDRAHYATRLQYLTQEISDD